MKLLAVMLGVAVGCMAVMGALRLGQQERSSKEDAARIMHEAARMQERARAWAGFRKGKGIPLAQVYARVCDDLVILARNWHVSCLIKVEGAVLPDILAAAVDSAWEGVRELRVQAVFSGVDSRQALLSFLEGVDALQREGAVVFRRVLYRGNAIVIDLTLMGVEA